jgi:hypothetical protein
MKSVAHVATAAGPRYAKQLRAHLAHRVPVVEQGDGAWTVTVGAAQGRVTATSLGVDMQVDAPDEAALAEMQHVLGDHLQRFGRRDKLVVRWHPATG